nr:unnamed protein product [Callosobruchus analis]
MSMDKVALSSSVEVPESTPVVIRRNSDDDKRGHVGITKRSSNPFVAFPSTEELPDEPSYVIPRRHSDDDKRTIDTSRNPFPVIFKTSDFGRRTIVDLKNDSLSRQDSAHTYAVPRRDSGYVENDVLQISERNSERKPQETSLGMGNDRGSQTIRQESDLHQTPQTIQENGHSFDIEQLKLGETNGTSSESRAHSTFKLEHSDTQVISRKAPIQPHGIHGILRRGSGPDETTDTFRRNSGSKNNDAVDCNIPIDAPRRPSVHFADMPRRNSDPKHQSKEQFPDTLRRSSEPEQGYLRQKKTWEKFPEVSRSSGAVQEYLGSGWHSQFPDVICRGSEPSQILSVKRCFQNLHGRAWVLVLVTYKTSEFKSRSRLMIHSQQLGFREAYVVDSAVQTPELFQKDAFLESVGVQADLSRRGSQEKRDNSADPAQSGSSVGISASAPKKSTPAPAVDERLAQRRRSLVPMSSMEEESLRERLHMAHLRCCSEIVLREQRYSRETFRKLFQNKVSLMGVLRHVVD